MDSFLSTLPQWHDDEQMRGLFAALDSLKDVNPESYLEKVLFWQRVVLEAQRRSLLSSHLFILDPISAKKFERKGVSPLGLSTVKEEMINKGVLKGKNELLSSQSSGLWSWIWSTLGWRNNGADGPLLCLPILEEYAEKLMSRFSGTLITDKNALSGTINKIRAGEGLPSVGFEDVQILVEYLICKQSICLLEGDLIRVRQSKGDKMTTTTAQIDQFLLSRTESRLVSQIEELTGQIDSLRDEVKQFLRQNDRPMALHRLRRSKALEAIRDIRLKNHSTIETILLRIEGAHSDADTFKAMKLGEEALRKLMQEQGMQVDNVQEVMSRLEDTLADQRQIEETLSQPIAAATVDNQDLEEELASLLAAEEKVEVTNEAELLNRLENLKLEPVVAITENVEEKRAEALVE